MMYTAIIVITNKNRATPACNVAVNVTTIPSLPNQLRWRVINGRRCNGEANRRRTA